MSVLFADLVGFTTLSERLDAEDVATVQDAYFGAVRETIGRYGGTLEKFIGDAAMAVFGSPRTRDDDAERAVRAGLALTSAVEQLSARIGLDEGELRLRVGVNTGEVVHAEAGPDQGRVTGDTVNTAARFQTAAPPGGVLVGETTALAVADAVELEPAGALDLKGKAEPVRAWRALAVHPERSREHAMGNLRAPTIGRETELSVLNEAFAHARTNERATRLVIVAPPGVGKTRLLEEFARAVAEDDSPAARFRARLRPDVVSPYQPIAQLVLSALAGAGLDFRSDVPSQAEALTGERLAAAGVSEGRAGVVTEHLLALIAPSEGTDEPSSRISAERDAMFQAWLEGLDALARGATQVWLVEDVHWAGGDVLAFLDFAGRTPCPGGRLVLTTARPSLLESSPAWSEATEAAAVLHLPPLSRPDAGALMSALVGEALPEDLRGRIAERSDGNPLFIEELLRTWISVRALLEVDGTWQLAAPASEIPLPTTVQAIYAGQIDDLPPDARQVARRAAVAGRRFGTRALEPLEVDNAEEGLDSLVRRALVAEVPPDPILGPAFAYRHALLRDAGYASLARAERARLHVRLARWLEGAAGERFGEVAELIASHYASALESAPSLAKDVGDGVGRDEARTMAAHWFERAAEAALAVAAHDAARTLFRRALDLTAEHQVLDTARRWHRLGDATAFAGDMDEGASAFQRAADLALELMRTPSATDAERKDARSAYAFAVASLGNVWNEQIRFPDASALADEALRNISEADDRETGHLLYLRAWSTYNFQIVPSVRVDLERVLAIAQATGDRELELDARHLFTGLLGDLGEISRDELLAGLREVESLATELRLWPRACLALRFQAGMLIEDRAEEALPIIDRASEMAEANGLMEILAWVDYSRSEAGFVSGDWDGALDAGLRAIELSERNAYHRPIVRTWFVLVAIASLRGRRDLVTRAADWFEAESGRFPPSPYAKLMHGAMNVWFREAGLETPPLPSPNDFLPVFDETLALPSAFTAIEKLCSAWTALGRVEDATTVLDRLAGSLSHPLATPFWSATEALCRAKLLQATGEPARVAERATEALKAYRTCRAPWWISKSIRLLEAAGAADPNLVKEAVEIEMQLGIANAPTAD